MMKPFGGSASPIWAPFGRQDDEGEAFAGDPDAYGADTPQYDARAGVKSSVGRDYESTSAQCHTAGQGVIPAGSFAGEAWLRVESHVGNMGIVGCLLNTGSNWGLFIESSQVKLGLKSTTWDKTAGTTLSVATWYQVLFWYNSSTGELATRVNDTTLASKTHADAGGACIDTGSPSNTFCIANYNSGSGPSVFYFDGIVARVRIYDGISSLSSYATTLYNSGTPLAWADLPAALKSATQSGAGHAYELDESSGAAQDVGQSLHLTATNAPVGIVGAVTATTCTASSSSHGPAITSVEDQGTSGLDLTQSTLAACPQLRLDPDDSLAALYFDGSDDYLAITSDTVLSGAQGAIFASWRPAGTGTIWAVGESTSGGGYLQGRLTAHVTREMDVAHLVENSGDQDVVRGGSVVSTGSWTTMVWISSGAAYTLRVGGSAETNTVVTADDSGDWVGDITTPTRFAIGALLLDSASAFAGGYLRELWAVASAPTATQAAASESYMGTYA